MFYYSYIYVLSTDIRPLPVSEIFPCPCLYPMFPFLSRHNHHYLLRVDRDSASTNTVQLEESHRWANLKSGTHQSPTALPAPTQDMMYDLTLRIDVIVLGLQNSFPDSKGS